MAMRPFIGYHVGDYLQHWIDTGQRVEAVRLPKIFFVNWYHQDDGGLVRVLEGVGVGRAVALVVHAVAVRHVVLGALSGGERVAERHVGHAVTGRFRLGGTTSGTTPVTMRGTARTRRSRRRSGRSRSAARGVTRMRLVSRRRAAAVAAGTRVPVRSVQRFRVQASEVVQRVEAVGVDHECLGESSPDLDVETLVTPHHEEAGELLTRADRSWQLTRLGRSQDSPLT
jgi:hypothetical protein